MSNHPWRTNKVYFNCPPNCPNRKPGCQDHCERYAKDRAIYNEHKRIERDRKKLDHYVCAKLAQNKEEQLHREKHKRTFRSPSHKGG